MLDAWRAWRGDGMGRGPLPFAGGYADQPAGLVVAFDAMDAAAAKVGERKRPKGRG